MLSASTIYRSIGVLLACWLLLSSCGNAAKEVIPTQAPLRNIPEEGKDITSYLSEGAKVKGKLTAPFMLRYQQTDTPYTEFPRTLHTDFYDDSMKVESQMDALYGKYLQNQNKVYLRDSVVVKNILKGDTLYTNELWWDQHTEKFYTDKPVRIHTKDKVLHGIGMEADQNFRWYTIKKLTGSVLTSDNSIPK